MPRLESARSAHVQARQPPPLLRYAFGPPGRPPTLDYPGIVLLTPPARTHSPQDILALRDIDEELEALSDQTVVQLGQASSDDAVAAAAVAGEGKGGKGALGGKADKKGKGQGGAAAKGKGKDKVSSPPGKKPVTAAAAAGKKKALHGLLVLRPVSAGGPGGAWDDAAAAPNAPAGDGFDGFDGFDGADGASAGAGAGAGALPPLVVGRSSRQNDRVSFEVAKEHHLWFHVQVRPIRPLSSFYLSPYQASI